MADHDVHFFPQENAKDKQLAEVQSSQTPGKLAQTRSVFENTPEQSQPSITADKFFPPPKPPRVAAIAEANIDHCETVNLNDVNIHEITFNFDFGQFDQELEQDRGSMFVSYEEKCKQVWLFFFLPFTS